jgi:carbonic anhydrase
MGIARMCLSTVLLLGVLARAEDAPKPEEKHWSYLHGITPTKWGEVSPTCATGGHQSPIALSTKQAKPQAPAQPLELSWTKATGELVDTGHSDQVNLPPGSFITYGGKRYELQQFHFHSPSEHTIDGKHAPLEAHFVHRSEDGKLAVVGILLKQGTSPSPFAPVLTALPATGEKKSVEVDLPALLPKSTRHFAYAGSLTTPPCSEGVTWLVLKSPSTLSEGEIERFGSVYPMNARPVQPLHERVVRASP